MNYFGTYFAQNILLGGKEKASEIKRSQNNYFLFDTLENIYILVHV